MTLPLGDFIAVTLVAYVEACAFALPAYPYALALAGLTLRCSLAVTPLALSPLVFDFCTAATVTMSTSNLFRPSFLY